MKKIIVAACVCLFLVSCAEVSDESARQDGVQKEQQDSEKIYESEVLRVDRIICSRIRTAESRTVVLLKDQTVVCFSDEDYPEAVNLREGDVVRYEIGYKKARFVSASYKID